MRGHLPLLEMRRAGLRASLIFLDVGVDRLKCWKDWHVDYQDYPHVNLDNKDDPATSDLRFVYGMNVLVTQLPGASAERVLAFAEVARAFGASIVKTELAP
jgi:hypothetical protein